jgi:hypothetical protein
LRNVVRQAAALTGSGAIDRELAVLVEKKLKERAGYEPQSDRPHTSQPSSELNSFISSLLDGTWPEAKSGFEKAYGQKLLIKTSGDYKEMMDLAGIKKTTAYEFINHTSLPQFTADDLIDITRLATKLKEQTDPVSTYVRGYLKPGTRQALKEYDGGEPIELLRDALVKELNRLIKEPNLYQAERFRQVQQSDETRDLIDQHGLHTDLFRLNRMLLEDAYPQELRKRRPSPEDSNKEGPVNQVTEPAS